MKNTLLTFALVLLTNELSWGCQEYGAAPAVPGNLSVTTLGSDDDACGNLQSAEGAVLLMGGGGDVDDAFSQRVRRHIGRNKDVVVLRTSGSSAYNSYLRGLTKADSVSTLIVNTRSKANSAYVSWAIRSAEFVWISGGDQSDYLNTWEGTALQSAMQHVFDKGGVIGGTSAGMAVLSDVIYDPDGVAGAVSEEVVENYCHPSLQFSSRFLDIPFLDNTIADTHFYERDRLGRLLVFMAHQSSNIVGIGASESTSIFIERDGSSIVDGRYEVYVTRETARTDLLEARCGKAVRYRDVSRVKLVPGDTYNFDRHTHTGTALDVAIDGRDRDFYQPNNPY